MDNVNVMIMEGNSKDSSQFAVFVGDDTFISSSRESISKYNI